MKKILLIAFIAITGFATAQTAYVDTDYLIANMPEVKVADGEITTFQQQLQRELNAAEANANTKFQSLREQAQDETLPQEKRAALAVQAEDLQKELQRSQKLAEIQLNTESSKIMKPIYEKLNAAIEKVAKDRGYKMIVSVNTVLYADENLNITKLVQAELGF